MTLLEMLDVLEGGCHALQQKNAELAAVLEQVRTSAEGTAVIDVNPVAEAPKQRRATKRKSKGTAKKRGKAVANKKAAKAAPKPVEEAAPDGEAKPIRGKRQALGMSFSKLREAIQARRAGQREQQAEAESA